jgi:SAM-dependent methyltransferase
VFTALVRLIQECRNMTSDSAKQNVHDFWNEASCGESLLLPSTDKVGFDTQASERYRLEPYIVDFAQFSASGGARVLEIGVGLGADHQRFAAAGAQLTGVDLTDRAVTHTRRRLALYGLASDLQVADAENLPFDSQAFDNVYSWGVLHHSPNTPKAILEVHRVLRNGGHARIMIYHTWSMVGLMLWLRYALLRFRPFTSMAEIYSRYLESPGTKAYTVAEARKLFDAFSRVEIRTVLTHGDLLESGAGQRHGGGLLTFARSVWPRWLIRRIAPGAGLFMLITAQK